MSTQSPTQRVQGTGTPVGSDLCTQCGLCCTGALHHYAVLEAEEIGFAEALGLELRRTGRPGFQLPCPLLKGCSCSVYMNRPAVCARYKCQLLQDVESGVTEPSAALAKVAIAKNLVVEVERKMQPAMGLPEARDQCFSEREHHNEDRSSLHLKLALTALCLYLDSNFKHGKEAKLLTLEPIPSRHDQMEME